jgi:hypothetical protein
MYSDVNSPYRSYRLHFALDQLKGSVTLQVHLQTVHLPPKMSATQLTDHHKFTSMSSSTSRFCPYLPVRLRFNRFQEKPLRS